jgi:hypothetical protein
MAQACTVCRHPKRPEIDRALVTGAADLKVAKDYGLARSSVQRHKARHIAEQIAEGLKARGVENATAGNALWLQVEGLLKTAMEILESSKTTDKRTALGAIREARDCMRLIAEVQGQLNAGTTVNVAVSQEWHKVANIIVGSLESYQGRVLEALARFPEAQAELERVLPRAQIEAAEALKSLQGESNGGTA